MNGLRHRLRTLNSSPLFLLVLTGVLLGSTLPVARIGFNLGWSSVAFVFWTSLGAGLVLLAIHARKATAPRLSLKLATYCLVSGLLTVAIPNSITFMTMPRLGTSLTSMLYTLPSIFTYLLAWKIGMERPHPLRLSGILIGLVGALVLALAGKGGLDEVSYWLAIALCTPLSLAAGNIYRKVRVPDGVGTGFLAGGMLLGGAASLLPAVIVDATYWSAMDGAGLAALVQCALIALSFVVYFRFQHVADPVYFSQLGYVMAATGVLSGVIFFRERPTAALGFGAALIVIGIILVNRKFVPRPATTEGDMSNEFVPATQRDQAT